MVLEVVKESAKAAATTLEPRYETLGGVSAGGVGIESRHRW